VDVDGVARARSVVFLPDRDVDQPLRYPVPAGYGPLPVTASTRTTLSPLMVVAARTRSPGSGSEKA
jgi:hypothetical protein